MSEVDEQPRTGVSWMQVAGSALAAVSSAVVLSTLGVAGTVIGAALGSVVATVGTALYTRTLDASRQQVAAQAAALRRVTRARSELEDVVAAGSRGRAVSATGLSRAGRELDHAEEALAAASGSAAGSGDQGTLAGSDVRRGGGLSAALLSRLSWKRVALLAAAVFLVAMVAITAFELVAGRAVSDITGGTDTPKRSTVPVLGGTVSTPTKTPTPTSTPTDAGSSGSSPTGQPTTATTDPTGDPAPTSSPTSEPTPSTSPTPTPTPTETPTPSPQPSESPALAESPSASPSSTGEVVASG